MSGQAIRWSGSRKLQAAKCQCCNEQTSTRTLCSRFCVDDLAHHEEDKHADLYDSKLI